MSAAVSIALYLLYFAGLSLCFSEVFETARLRMRLGKRLRNEAAAKKNGDAFTVWLGELASSSLQREISGEAAEAALAGIFALSFALALQSFYLLQALLIAVMCVCMPPALMYIRLSGSRSRSSREGLSLISELARQYRLHGKNIFTAIEETVAAGGDYPVCRKQLYRLLLRLRSASGREEIKRCTDSFAFAMGTVWGSMLAACIRLAAERGSDISEGLADIARQLGAAYKRAEERQRLNSESARMTLFLVPLLYAGTMVMAVRYLGISPEKLAANQFLSPEGLLFFLVSLFLFIVDLAVLRALSNIKLDY